MATQRDYLFDAMHRSYDAYLKQALALRNSTHDAPPPTPDAMTVSDALQATLRNATRTVTGGNDVREVIDNMLQGGAQPLQGGAQPPQGDAQEDTPQQPPTPQGEGEGTQAPPPQGKRVQFDLSGLSSTLFARDDALDGGMRWSDDSDTEMDGDNPFSDENVLGYLKSDDDDDDSSSDSSSDDSDSSDDDDDY